MITTNNTEQAKSQIKKALAENKKPIIVKAQSLEFNRKLLEYGKFDILLDIHTSETNQKEKQKDKLKYLASGLNHVLAKIAAKNSISIGIDLEKIRSLEKKQKALALARIKQNIKLCRKAKAKITLLNYKEKRNAFSLLISLGASTQQAQDAAE